ncbi:hypothetical protein B7494_g858 [Chlorociboria aeruginascens]|nr:hypothetical protein B7494_g858 [Chlorociboria aeruginascens]
MAEPQPSPPRPPSRPFLPLPRPGSNPRLGPGRWQQARHRSPYSSQSSTEPDPSTQPLYQPVSVPPSSSTEQHHAAHGGLGLTQRSRSSLHPNITENAHSLTVPPHNPSIVPTARSPSSLPEQIASTTQLAHNANSTNGPLRPSNAPFTAPTQPPRSRMRLPRPNQQAPAQHIPPYASASTNGLQSSLGFAVGDPRALPQVSASRGILNNDAHASSRTYPPPLNYAPGFDRRAPISQARSFGISSTGLNSGLGNAMVGLGAQSYPFRQIQPRPSRQAVSYAIGFPNGPQHPQGGSVAGPSTQAPLGPNGLGIITQASLPPTAAFLNRPRHPPRNNTSALRSGRVRRTAHPSRNATSVQNQQTVASQAARFSNTQASQSSPYLAHLTNTHPAPPSGATIRTPGAPLPDPRQTDTRRPRRFPPQGHAPLSPQPLNRPAHPPRNLVHSASNEQPAPHAPYSAHFENGPTPRPAPTIGPPREPSFDEARRTDRHGRWRSSHAPEALSNRQFLSQPPLQNPPLPHDDPSFRYYAPDADVASHRRRNAVAGAGPRRFSERSQAATDGAARQPLQTRERFPPERGNRNAAADSNRYFQGFDGFPGTEERGEIEIYDDDNDDDNDDDDSDSDDEQETPLRNRRKGGRERRTRSIYSLYITPVVDQDLVSELYNRCYAAIQGMDEGDGAVISEAEGLVGFVHLTYSFDIVAHLNDQIIYHFTPLPLPTNKDKGPLLKLDGLEVGYSVGDETGMEFSTDRGRFFLHPSRTKPIIPPTTRFSSFIPPQGLRQRCRILHIDVPIRTSSPNPPRSTHCNPRNSHYNIHSHRRHHTDKRSIPLLPGRSQILLLTIARDTSFVIMENAPPSKKVDSKSPVQKINASPKVKTDPPDSNQVEGKAIEVDTKSGLAIPSRLAQSPSGAEDYFSVPTVGHHQFETNPFDQSFGGGGAGAVNGATAQTPNGTKLPSVAALTSPANLLPGVTPGFWSLRSGPLSPAMLSGPAKGDDYFSEGHHLRGGFPTPNESGLRSGLTPGGGGSMFPEPTPTNALYSQLQSGAATPSTIDFHRTALNARAVNQTRGQQAQQLTSQPPDMTNGMEVKPAISNGQFDQHDANDAANGLFLLAQARSAPQQQPNHYAMAPQMAVHAHPQSNMQMPAQSIEASPNMGHRNNRSMSTASGLAQSEVDQSYSDQEQKAKPVKGKGKRENGRKKASEAPKSNKKGKANNGNPIRMEPPSPSPEEELDMSKDQYNESGKKMTDEEKRKNFLERNRQRKKQWLQSLQQKVEFYTQENEGLQATIGSLNDELVNIKTLLLAHKDCPVAHQQGITNQSFQNIIDGFTTQIQNVQQMNGGHTNGGQVNPYGMAGQPINNQQMIGIEQQRRFSQHPV